MGGPTGAVKSFSVPGFTLKTDMSPMGEAPKAKEAGKAEAKPAADGFEAAKAAPQAGAMAAQAGGGQLPPVLQGPVNFLRQAHATLQNLANTLPWPLNQVAQRAADAVKQILDTIDGLVQAGQQIGQGVINAVNNIVNWLRNLPVIGPLLGGGN